RPLCRTPHRRPSRCPATYARPCAAPPRQLPIGPLPSIRPSIIARTHHASRPVRTIRRRRRRPFSPCSRNSARPIALWDRRLRPLPSGLSLPRNRAARLRTADAGPPAPHGVRLHARIHPRAVATSTKGFTPMARTIAFAFLAAAVLSGTALADDYLAKTLRISNPFTRATPPGAKVAGAFLSIENQGKETDRLVSVSSPIAGLAQIHEMVVDGGLMKMRAVKGIDLKPGATVELRPGASHVMLETLKR